LSIPAHSRLVRTWLTIGLVSVVSVIAGAAAQTAMAWRFGTSGSLDAFYVALLLATVVPTIYQTAVADPLIPVYMKADAHRRFAETVFALTLATGVLAAGVLVLARHPLIGLVSPGFSARQADMAAYDVACLAFVPLLYAAASCMTALLAARQQFVVARAAAMVIPAAQCIGILSARDESETSSLVWSTVAGYFVYALILWIRCGLVNPFAATVGDLRSPAMRRLFVIGAPMTVTIAAGSLYAFIDRGMASRLGSGSIATLAYGEKLNSVLVAVFLIPLTLVALPSLSATVSRSEFLDIYVANLRTALLVFIPLAVLAGAMSIQLVDTGFRRGSFGPQDVTRVAGVFSAYMVGIPFYAVAGLTGRAFVATGRTWILAVLSPAALLTKWLLNLWLMPRYDVAGAALATSVGYIVFACVTFVLILERSELRRVLRELPFVGTQLVGAAAGWGASRPLIASYASSLSLAQRAAVLTEAAVLFAAVYCAVIGAHMLFFRARPAQAGR
jgi:putative peptidoglycan lipid II flippase